MAHDAAPSFGFDTPTAPALQATFDRGRKPTADGGPPRPAETDSELGPCENPAASCVPERRRGLARRSFPEDLVRQRVPQVACGCEDQDDADSPRSGPPFELACGRLPETGHDLAGWPTLSRPGNAATGSACYRMARMLVELHVGRRRRDPSRGAPKKVPLGFDSTADPAHGEQEEGVTYHGYFGQHVCRPLSVFDAETGQIVAAVLRPGNAHAGHGASSVLERLVGRLRGAWPEVGIETRADAGASHWQPSTGGARPRASATP